MPSFSSIALLSVEPYLIFMLLEFFLNFLPGQKPDKKMNLSPMHHRRRPSSTLSLKFTESKRLREEEEEESDMEEELEEDEVESEEEDEFGDEEEGFKREEEEQEEEEEDVEEIQVKKKRTDLDGGCKRSTTDAAATGGGGGGSRVAPPLICRVENCDADLSGCKKYHIRHRVCEYHAKAQVAMVDGLRQRFCQQCSRFHALPEFDETKRSCRRRLEGHNARRRKNSMESRGEGSGDRGSSLAPEKDQCRLVEEIGRGQMAFPKNHQNFHIH